MLTVQPGSVTLTASHGRQRPPTALPDNFRGALSQLDHRSCFRQLWRAVSARVPEHLREAVADTVENGATVRIYPADTEQGRALRTAGARRRVPTDFDGLTPLPPRPQVKNLQTRHE
ncbi:type I-E CRISPR-associated endoribonuclease Cas2 [Streptomyces triticagri]|uniref:Type I-E CRISPR-associated endoribonuclease Cas2 n=1 Tax=Streptomyces triticagri TaxID=2293568 RepID=A0A372M2N9_9ACTN|nr:type I-E CRISPR-associated endoribonuclease Cas2 [Streptomyces triticagri]RFU85196.1 type I-E CRISPR-associated endoribonuclease Cas2 [Streptomyces triticagri]